MPIQHLAVIPAAMNRANRAVTLRHPKAIPASVWRKSVSRVETVGGGVSESDGMPTLGGMGVMRATDEAEFDYTELGAAMVLLTDQFQAGAEMAERGDMVDQAALQPARIECAAEEGAPAWFACQRGDLVLLLPGLGTVIPFSVEGVPGSAAIPPFVSSYMLQPRDELAQLAPWQAGAVTPL